MRINAYDRVSSFMMAAVLAMICLVFAAIAYWFQTRRPVLPELVAMEVVDVVGGGELDGSPDETLAVESPETAETEQVDVQQQLDAVTNVSDKAALQAAVFQPDVEAQDAQGSVTGTGRRPLGFGPGSGGGVARELRWAVSFANEESLATYAQQLDYFKIELGARSKDGRLTYLTNLSKSPTSRNVASGKDEKRLYFTWQGGARKSADIQLFRQAGVNAEQSQILHFYSEELENHLATLELKYANRPAKDIRRTYFTVVPKSGGFAFQVIRQTYLR